MLCVLANPTRRLAVAGDGSSPNITGLGNTTGVQGWFLLEDDSLDLGARHGRRTEKSADRET
jgi:hypothetical protein